MGESLLEKEAGDRCPARSRDRAPLLWRTVCAWLSLELVIVFVAPLCVPKTWYLSWYLRSKSVRATRDFLEGRALLVPDDVAGWRNKTCVAHGNWVIDEEGSRFAHDRAGRAGKPLRVMLLGSSIINGGTGVRNDQTISAYLENDRVEALNFGTMLYQLDQVLLRYRSEWYEYRAKEVIVGLDSASPEGLGNLYLPFLFRDEKNMPFLKPRFELSGGSLRLVPVRPGRQLARIPDDPELLEFLEKHDVFYHRFDDYRRTGFSPLAACYRLLSSKLSALRKYLRPGDERSGLLFALMREMVTAAREHGARVTFVMLPRRGEVPGRGADRVLPDAYSLLLRMIGSKGFAVVDGRRALLSSHKPVSELFHRDGVHYSPAANEVIARALASAIEKGHSGEENDAGQSAHGAPHCPAG